MSERLMELYHFTLEDLSNNRQGKFSPEQQSKIGSTNRTVGCIAIFLGLLLLGGAGALLWLAYTLYNQGITAWPGPVVIAGILGLLSIFLLLVGIRRPKQALVEVARGPVKLTRVDRSRQVSTGSSSYLSHYTATEMNIGGQIFTLPDGAFSEIEEGAEYAVYYYTGGILSLERI